VGNHDIVVQQENVVELFPMTTNNRSVLVAEDNAILADVLRFNLQRAGFEVVTVENGRLALEELEQRPFDLLITDYQMPEVDGQLLCQSIRKQAAFANLPIIMCSAKGLELDTRALCEEYQISKVIFKPFSTQELVALARELTTVEITQANV
jgi:DNA-binding response OmpR family regulator